jgi:hypothetical protein
METLSLQVGACPDSRHCHCSGASHERRWNYRCVLGEHQCPCRCQCQWCGCVPLAVTTPTTATTGKCGSGHLILVSSLCQWTRVPVLRHLRALVCANPFATCHRARGILGSRRSNADSDTSSRPAPIPVPTGSPWLNDWRWKQPDELAPALRAALGQQRGPPGDSAPAVVCSTERATLGGYRNRQSASKPDSEEVYAAERDTSEVPVMTHWQWYRQDQLEADPLAALVLVEAQAEHSHYGTALPLAVSRHSRTGMSAVFKLHRRPGVMPAGRITAPALVA